MTVSPSVVDSVAASSAQSPSDWVVRWLSGLPAGARVLDFASGNGRHIPLLTRLDYDVWAIDVDESAIDVLRQQHGLAADRALQADLEATSWPLPRQGFDAVIVTRYLFRPRWALLADLLAPAGRLIYETFAEGQALFGRPTRPDFLLRPGELFERCRQAGLSVLAYEDGVVGSRADGPPNARVQRVCAVRPRFDVNGFRLDLRVG